MENNQNKPDREPEWDIEEPNFEVKIEVIYCGNTNDTDNRKSKYLQTVTVWILMCCTVIFFGGAFVGFTTNDWYPLKFITDCICRIIESIMS